MAHLNAQGNPIVATPLQAPAQAPAASGQPLIDINELRTAFSNPKAAIPLYFGDSTRQTCQVKTNLKNWTKFF